MASAHHQSDTVVKHWASPPGSGNWFFCKSQRLGCERGREDGEESSWEEWDEMGGRANVFKWVRNCWAAICLYFLNLKSRWTSISQKQDTARLETWAETCDTQRRSKWIGLLHSRRFYVLSRKAQVWLITLIRAAFHFATLLLWMLEWQFTPVLFLLWRARMIAANKSRPWPSEQKEMLHLFSACFLIKKIKCSDLRIRQEIFCFLLSTNPIKKNPHTHKKYN